MARGVSDVMMTDDQVDGIENALRANGDIHTLLLRRWLSEMIADRKDRIAQQRDVRERLEHLFRRLNGLCEPKPAKARTRRLRHPRLEARY